MNFSIDNITKYLKYLWARRKTKHGFLLSVVFVVVLFYGFPPVKNLSLINQTILCGLVLLLLFLFWFVHSGRFTIPSKRIKVAISLKSLDPESQKIISITFLRLNDKLKALNVKQNFIIFEIGTDIFDTNEQAERYLLKQKLNLIIHGTVYSGNFDGNYRYDLRNFFFTYNVENIPKDDRSWAAFDDDVKLMIAQRDWIIDENESLLDTEKASTNLVEILLSIISITIATSRSLNDLEISISLIEVLIPFIESQVDPEYRKINISPDKSEIRMPINLLRSGRLRFILNLCYIIVSIVYTENKKYNEAEEVLKKALKSGADKIDCYANLALVKYYMKDLKAAEKYTLEIGNISKDDPIFLVNMAFFSIKKKNYSDMMNHYKHLRNVIKDKDNRTIKKVLRFLDDRKKEEPKELAYLYAIGILNYNYKSKNDGREILLKFIDKANGKSEYTKVVSTVKDILKI